jgi:metal-responsive CopG/Arc/MetJ family transcriptional regulator
MKTTIDLEDELWKKFSIKVIQDYGGRKKNDIIEALVAEFVNDPSKTIEEALEEWLAKEETAKKRKTKEAKDD